MSKRHDIDNEQIYDERLDNDLSLGIRIRNFEHYRSIILKYGKDVFPGIVCPTEILEFIIDRFDNPCYDYDKLNFLTTKFIRLMVKYFKVGSLKDLNRGEMICKGTYGNIYESAHEDRVYKSCKIDSHYQLERKRKKRKKRKSKKSSSDSGNDSDVELDDKYEIFKSCNNGKDMNISIQEFMFEIVNYIIWRAIAFYCNDRSKLLGIELPDLTYNFTTLYKPYIVIVSRTNNKIFKFRVGYELDRFEMDIDKFLRERNFTLCQYTNTLQQMQSRYTELINQQKKKKDLSDSDGSNRQSNYGLSSSQDDDITKSIEELENNIKKYKDDIKKEKKFALDALTSIVSMMSEFREYDQYDISLLHRDASSKNIMLYCYEDSEDIRPVFVDLSSLKTKITFVDGASILIGHYFDRAYNSDPAKYYDLVFFFLFSYHYIPNIFDELGIYSDLTKILKLDKCSNMIDTEKSITVWLYPYKILFNYSKFKKQIDKLLE